jgi:hypothetical protein
MRTARSEGPRSIGGGFAAFGYHLSGSDLAHGTVEFLDKQDRHPERPQKTIASAAFQV